MIKLAKNMENLFTALFRELEDFDAPRLNDKKAAAWLSLAKQAFLFAVRLDLSDRS